MSALMAFEATARLKGVAKAAEALHTSPSAVSRHIRYLEDRLAVALFHREGRGLCLTASGQTYYLAVSAALSGLGLAEQQLDRRDRSLTIACSYSVSHLLVMPRYDRLKAAVGKGIEVNILTSDYGAKGEGARLTADIVIGYDYDGIGNDVVEVMPEQITVVASPGCARANSGVLAGPLPGWVDLPRLELSHENLGWACWSDWFRANDIAPDRPPAESFSNYVYLLEAAAAGAGLAIGWRGFIERHVRAGVLETVSDRWITLPRRLRAWQTIQASGNRSVAPCMRFFSTLSESLENPVRT
jgi:LysR family glycine cleavage system transcriptional activator